MLTRLFAPQSVAIVGASDRSTWTYSLFHNLERSGRAVYPVNPRRGEVLGRPCAPGITAIPEPVGLAFILTQDVEQAMEEAAAAGVGNIVAIGSGFAEAGPEGRRREQALVAAARRHGQILLGPNNMGFANFADGFHPFGQVLPAASSGAVGIVSQSGGLAYGLMEYAAAKGIGLSHAISIGNGAMIGPAEAIHYLVDHPQCRAVALFVEAIGDTAAFVAAALAGFAAGKPIVAYKTGRSVVGKRAAAAHTGALASDDAVTDAVFAQLGIVRVDSPEDLLVTAALLGQDLDFGAGRLGVLTPSGAAGGMVADRAEMAGVPIPALAAETVAELGRSVMPGFAGIANPLDTTAYLGADPAMAAKAIRLLLDDSNIDVALFGMVNSLPQDDLAARHLGAIMPAVVEEGRRHAKPLLLADFFSVDYSPFAHDHRRQAGVPFILPSIEKGVPALGRALWWAKRQREGIGIVVVGAAASTSDIVPEPGRWSEVQSRDYLAAQGVPMVPARFATTADDAVAAAQSFGEPVAIKLVSPEIAHKSDIGGVRLDVAGDEAVRAAYTAVMAAAGAAGASADGVLVSPMRRGGVEMLVGVVRDPQWGLVLAVALGGVFTEILGDTALRVLPVSRPEIARMLDQLAGRSLLDGVRGTTPADRVKLVETIAAVAAAACRFGDRLDALEINPLRVDGDEIEALDALVGLIDGGGDIDNREDMH